LRARCTVKWATSLSTMWRWSTPCRRPKQASHHLGLCCTPPFSHLCLTVTPASSTHWPAA
jgi:hypothetical protein